MLQKNSLPISAINLPDEIQSVGEHLRTFWYRIPITYIRFALCTFFLTMAALLGTFIGQLG
jgi:hypothetical protein